VFLSTLTTASLQPYQFAYDGAGAGELTSVTSPYGGQIGWSYGSFVYTGSRTLREVNARFLAPDSAHITSPPWTYGISRPDPPNAVTVHTGMTLTDASGNGAKTWTFNTSNTAPAWQLGLISRFQQLTAANGTVIQDDSYTWSQDPGGHPYISSKTSVTDGGTANQQSALSTQTDDQYGNVTQSVIYPYNNTTTPLRTYNNTWVTTPKYAPYYIFNLLSTSTLTVGATTTTLVSNLYEYGGCMYTSYSSGIVECGGFYNNPSVPPPTGPPISEYDPISPVPVGSKGILAGITTNASTTLISYYQYGGVAVVFNTDGTISTASADPAINYAAPQSISVQSYNQTVSYTPWLGISSQTGQNGERLSMWYDTYGRPSTATSPFGAVTTYAYPTANTQTQTGPDGFTRTTVDGFGRTIRVERGSDSTHLQSVVDSVYSPCACSPLGKLQKVSQPYASGGSASGWTTYTYDGIGRTLAVQQPDGASTTTYVYTGNQTKVIDPAGKWKQFTNDVLGNLTTVVEPDPANQPSGTLTTSYTYDWMGHVTQVTMPRGATTQTRTFVYDNAGRLTSATNPENGTVTYTYNADNTLQRKHDAKGQEAVYTYDALKRVTVMQRFVPSGNSLVEDPCQHVVYYWGSDPSSTNYTYGRLSGLQYFLPNGSQSCSDSIGENYSYHRAGATTAKILYFNRSYTDWYLNQYSASGAFEVDYTYDQAGRTASVTYPMTRGGALTTTYDAMGRPASLTNKLNGVDAGLGDATAQYDYAGRMTTLSYTTGTSTNPSVTQSLTYNVSGQLASLSGSFNGQPGGIQYVYSATQNNGQITQAIDTFSGETISYQYDALKRLISASAAPTAGSSPAPWTQTFQYDGFGNLTSKALNGTATPVAVNAATNRLTYGAYDANGNMTGGVGATLVYDAGNRLTGVYPSGGGAMQYRYDPGNKLIYKSSGGITNESFTFYGAKGEKLGVYSIQGPWTACSSNPSYCSTPTDVTFTPQATSIWFAGKLIVDSSDAVYQDRVGTNRAYGGRFYPYGEEITSPQTSNDRVKFGTYTRDSFSGLDYADQRFYAGTYGRFNTPDPARSSAHLVSPSSWNRYTYAANDPVNNNDPSGLYPCGSSGGQSGGVISVTVYDCPDLTYLAFRPGPVAVPYRMTIAEWEDIHPNSNPLTQKIHVCGDFFCTADGSLLGPIPASYMDASDPLANLLLFKGTTTVAGLLNGAFGTTFTAGEEIIAGLYGSTTRAALTAAAADTGSTTTVLTNLTDAPALGRALSVATGDGAAALAAQATAAGTLYTASIPNALIQQLIGIGAAFQYTTQMNGVVGTEIRFTAQASEYLIDFFKPVP
jgi:RHS repeat-associated protein